MKGKWPLAFTVWKYKEKGTRLDAKRSIPLLDLTWLSKKQLAAVPWNYAPEMETCCQAIVKDAKSSLIDVGRARTRIKAWTGEIQKDFKRSKTREERNHRVVGGLPLTTR